MSKKDNPHRMIENDKGTFRGTYQPVKDNASTSPPVVQSGVVSSNPQNSTSSQQSTSTSKESKD
jgi:hypothetical protein